MQIPLLTPRLKLIADKAISGKTMADIGTDHAYLPLHLIKYNKFSNAIASDIGKGPLERAEKTVHKYCMQDKISLRLGPGLETVTKSDNVDLIVIAGMGGLVISDIIENSKDVVCSAKQLILQPMTMAPELREYLYTSALGEIEEYIVFEGRKIYNIISLAINKETPPIKLSPIEAYVGKSLISSKPEGFDNYISMLENKLKNQVLGISHATENAEAAIKFKEVKHLICEIKKLKNTEAHYDQGI